jgi:hypothetical protein
MAIQSQGVWPAAQPIPQRAEVSCQQTLILQALNGNRTGSRARSIMHGYIAKS